VVAANAETVKMKRVSQEARLYVTLRLNLRQQTQFIKRTEALSYTICQQQDATALVTKGRITEGEGKAVCATVQFRPALVSMWSR